MADQVYTIAILRELIPGTDAIQPIRPVERMPHAYEHPELGLVLPGYDTSGPDRFHNYHNYDYASEIALKPLSKGGIEFRYRDPAKTYSPVWGRVWSPAQYCSDYEDVISWAYCV